jgi:putative transposase
VALTKELLQAGIAGSIGTVHHALSSARRDLLKTEAINLSGPAWRDRRDVEWQVARWVHWYNTTRLHSSIGHLPPFEFELESQRRHRQLRPRPIPEEVAQPTSPPGESSERFRRGQSDMGTHRLQDSMGAR